MIELTEYVDVQRPADAVWAAVTDWESQEQWMLLTRVWPTSGSGHAVGDQIAARTALGPVGFTDPMEITAWDPPRVCEVRHLGRVVRGSGVFAVEPLGDGAARFSWTERIPLPRFLWPLVAIPLRISLRRFGHWIARA